MSMPATIRVICLTSLVVFAACDRRPAPPLAADVTRTLEQVKNLRGRQLEAQALEVTESFFKRHAFQGGDASRELLELRRQHAFLLMTFSRLDAAVTVLGGLLQASRADSVALLLLGRCHARLGSFGDALKAYERLPDRTRQAELLDYGKVLLGAGRIESALTALAACLVRDPWLDAGYLAYGRALVRAGKPDDARVFLERYRKAEPFRRAEAEALRHERGRMLGLAQWKRGMGELDRDNLFGARERFRAAIRIDPGTAEAYLGLGRVSLVLDRPHRTIAFLRKLPPEAPFLALQGEAFELLGDHGAARGLYRQAREIDPTLNAAVEGLQRLDEGRERSKRDEAPEVASVRARVRQQTRKLELEKSTLALTELAQALYRTGSADEMAEAERVVLCLQQVAPTDGGVRQSVIEIAQREELVFFRLQALVQESQVTDTLRAELKRLALDRKMLGHALEGHRLGSRR